MAQMLMVLVVVIPLITLTYYIKESKFEITFETLESKTIFSMNKLRLIKGNIFLGNTKYENVLYIKHNEEVIYMK